MNLSRVCGTLASLQANIQWGCRAPNSITEMLIIKIQKTKHILHRFKDELLVKPTSVIFIKCFSAKAYLAQNIPSPELSPVDKLLQTVTSQAEVLQNSEIEIKWIPDLWWSSYGGTQKTFIYSINVPFVRWILFISKNLRFISVFSSVIHRLKLSQNNQTKKS